MNWGGNEGGLRGETASLLRHQEEYNSQLPRNLGVMIRGLAILLLTTVIILALCSVFSEDPHNPLNHHSNEVTLLWVCSIIYATTIVLLGFDVLFRHIPATNDDQETGNNTFLLFIDVILFMLASVLYLSFKLATVFYNIKCQSYMYFIEPIAETLFIFCAAAYAFDMFNRRIRGKTSIVLLSKVTISMVLISCVALWIKTLIIKEGEKLLPKMTTNQKMMRLINCSCNGSNEADKLYKKIEPFLSPFLIEFALTTACLLHLPLNRCGREKPNAETHHPAQADDGLPPKCGPVMYALILSAMSLLTFYFVLLDKKGSDDDNPQHLIIYNGIFIFVLPMTILVNILFCVQVLKCDDAPVKESQSDRLLLWLSVSGQFFISVGTLHAAFHLLPVENNPMQQILYRVSITCTFIRILQTFLQTISLDIALRKRFSTDLPLKGFQPSLILGILNLAFWLQSIGAAEINDTGLSMVQNNYYTEAFWSTMQSISYPLSVLYRIHSSALFYECFRETW